MTAGHFAGGFADSFTKVMQLRQNKKQRDKIAKLQGQLLEESLKAKQGQNDAMGSLEEMASGTLGEIEGIGGGETVDGRRTPELEFTGKNPMSLLEILSDPEGQMAAFRAGLIKPQEVLAENRLSRGLDIQEDLLGQVGDMGGGDFIPAGMTIDGRGRPSFQFSRSPDAITPVEADMQVNQLQQLLGAAGDVMDYGSRLEGTPFELGGASPQGARKLFGGLESVKQFFGFGGEESKETLNAFDRVQKALGQIQVNSPAFANATTDVGRRAALAALPEDAKRLEANLSVISSEIQNRIADMQDRKIPIPPEVLAQAQDLVRKLESFSPLKVEDIRALTPDDIRTLDWETVKNWSAEQRKALEARIDELNP